MKDDEAIRKLLEHRHRILLLQQLILKSLLRLFNLTMLGFISLKNFDRSVLLSIGFVMVIINMTDLYYEVIMERKIGELERSITRHLGGMWEDIYIASTFREASFIQMVEAMLGITPIFIVILLRLYLR